MRSYTKFLGLSVLFVLLVSVAGQTANRIHVDLKETRLANGLRIITVENHSAPVITVNITYNVGSRNEREGRTGVAHLFEHLMFEGSDNVGKFECSILINNNGGSLNASTNVDRTEYHERLPANQLDLALFVEADRMRSLNLNQENLDNQRAVVQEERRLTHDNAAYGKSNDVFQQVMYDNFAYKHPTIGSMADLNAATLMDVRAFFSTYYAPNNAVLTLVGDFKTDQALARIKKYFESIPRRSDPPPVDMTEPEQKGERRASIDDPLARSPLIMIGFKAVRGDAPDFFTLQLMAKILADGSSSRLHQKLVKVKELVTYLGVEMSESRGLGRFSISALLRPGVNAEEVEAAIYEEIERLNKEAVADWELRKAKLAARRSFINSLEQSNYMANTIGQYAVYYDDPNLINTRLDKVAAVTKSDIMQVANKYFAQSNRTVVITVPKAGQDKLQKE